MTPDPWCWIAEPDLGDHFRALADPRVAEAFLTRSAAADPEAVRVVNGVRQVRVPADFLGVCYLGGGRVELPR